MSTAPRFRAARSAATCNRLRNQPLFSWPARRSRRWHCGAGGAPSGVRPSDISKGHDVDKASCDPESSRASGDPRGRGAREVAFRLGGERGQGRAGTDGTFPRVLVAGAVNVPSERPVSPRVPYCRETSIGPACGCKCNRSLLAKLQPKFTAIPPGLVGYHRHIPRKTPFLSHHLTSPHFRLDPLPVLVLKAKG